MRALRSAAPLQRGRREEARGVLTPIYARFSEGFNSRRLTAARELLDESNSLHPNSATGTGRFRPGDESRGKAGSSPDEPGSVFPYTAFG
jgi:hypothetical protein